MLAAADLNLYAYFPLKIDFHSPLYRLIGMGVSVRYHESYHGLFPLTGRCARYFSHRLIFENCQRNISFASSLKSLSRGFVFLYQV